ncbi:MAG: hypothetical protein Q9219_003967 [cf. Caloplaca sp. 3 TL-2023]
MSHSKRNTSLAFFTTHERAQLRSTWGSQATRLTRDSFLPFASCNLCLQPARDPCACASRGDVFCRECVVSNLLAQRTEIQRWEKEEGRRRKEDGEREREKVEEERERSVRDFEKTMMGLEGGTVGGGGRGSKRKGETGVTEMNGKDNQEEGRGVKRKFELDEAEILRNAREERAKARKAIDDEQVSSSPFPTTSTIHTLTKLQSSKPTLPSFWLPSLTPSTGTKTGTTSQKSTPICPASTPTSAHPLSLKSLITITFSTSTATPSTTKALPSDSSSPLICPACNKTLSNASKAMLTIPCGHVLCKPCAQKFMTPVRKPPDPHRASNHDEEEEEDGSVVRCYVCSTNLSPTPAKRKKSGPESEKEKSAPKRGIVEIRSDGTGFAGGGENMARKEGIAFHC